MSPQSSNPLLVIFAACGVRLSVKPAIPPHKPPLGCVPSATEIISYVGNVSATTDPGRLQLQKGPPSTQENISKYQVSRTTKESGHLSGQQSALPQPT